MPASLRGPPLMAAKTLKHPVALWATSVMTCLLGRTALCEFHGTHFQPVAVAQPAVHSSAALPSELPTELVAAQWLHLVASEN
jgi:hypothetical protein